MNTFIIEVVFEDFTEKNLLMKFKDIEAAWEVCEDIKKHHRVFSVIPTPISQVEVLELKINQTLITQVFPKLAKYRKHESSIVA